MQAKKHSIKMFHTAPVAFMSQLEKHQDFLFIEAAMALENKKYADYILRLRVTRPTYIIMDNSAYLLGKSMPEKDFMRAYELFVPDCVVALDHPYDRDKTLNLTEAFIKKYRKRIDAKFMGVPQGYNYADYMVCFQLMKNFDELDIIGINMFMDWKHPSLTKLEKTERIYRFRSMVMLNIHHVLKEHNVHNLGTFKAIHLLGLTLGRELRFAIEQDMILIRSCDSSSAFIHGYYGTRYGKDGLEKKDWEHKMDFTIKDINEAQIKNIMHNVSTINSLRGF